MRGCVPWCGQPSSRARCTEVVEIPKASAISAAVLPLLLIALALDTMLDDTLGCDLGVASSLTTDSSASSRTLLRAACETAPSWIACHSLGVIAKGFLPAPVLERASAKAWRRAFWRRSLSLARVGSACFLALMTASARTCACLSLGLFRRASLTLALRDLTSGAYVLEAWGFFRTEGIASVALRA